MITIKDFTCGRIVKTKKNLIGRKTPYIDIGKTLSYRFNEGIEIEIIEKPRSYKGYGRCVKFKLAEDKSKEPKYFYTFYSEFKKEVIFTS